jgi:hypothetical protein
LSLVQDGLTGCEDTIERDLNESELRQLIERPMGVTSDRPVDSYGEPAWRERLTTASLVGDPAISDAVDEAIEQSRIALITEAEQLLEEAARATSAESVAYREMAITALRRVGFIVTAANEFIHVTVSNAILGFVVVITLLVECAGDILSDRERPTRSR